MPLQTRSAESPAPGRLYAAVALLLAATVLAHAALLPAAEWQGDEYAVVPGFAAEGWRELLHRVIAWSPRPVAETLYGTYCYAVIWTGRPLIAPALGLVWIGVAWAGAAWWSGAGPGLRARQLVTMALFATFLLGSNVSEVFYWPAGALVYLVALGALTLLLNTLLQGYAATDWRAVAALLVLAGSCEIGAMFALAFGAVVLPLGAGVRRWVRWALPVTLAAGVLIMLSRGRVAGASETMAPGSPTLHHGVASLRAAIQPFWSGLLGAAEGAHARWREIAARLALLLGLRACLARAALPSLAPRALAAFAIAALAAAAGSIAAAYYQFGLSCCQRHDTMRQCLFVLASTAIAALSLRLLPACKRRLWWTDALAPTLLLLASLPAAVPRVRALRHDLPLVATAATARAETWRSGQGPGEAMTFRLPPTLRLINPPFLAPGTYDAADPRWFVAGILHFFGKTSMQVLPSSAGTNG